MSEPLWTLTDATLGRPQRRLDRVTLTIPAGVTAVIGPSGAGKTSLLNLLVGFEQPMSGTLVRRVDAAARLPIGWSPADFGLWPHLSVREHLEYVESSHDQAAVASRIDELLQGFGLQDLQQARAGRLSQGERSRLAVARALAADPAVLVLDEPLVHVDPVRLDSSWQIIREHCRQRGTALVFSTHDPDVVLREATHVVCLDGGRLAYAGPVEELYHRPPTSRLARFLGPANWFEPDDHWFARSASEHSPRCVRPEQIVLEPHEDSPLVLEASQVAPLMTVSQVRDERTQAVRAITHRTTSTSLPAGIRVLLRLCVVLLMLLMIHGCQRSSASPQLPMSSTRTLKMPVDGGSIPAPRSLAVSAENELFVLDKAGRLLVYDSEGELDRSWWMPDYEIGKPEGVCILPDGHVVVADTHYHRVVIFDRDGEVLQMFGALGEGPGEFIYPVAVTCDDAGDLYVAEYGGNDRIQKFTLQGEWLQSIGSFGTDAGQFQRPSGIVWRRNDEGISRDASTPAAAAAGTLYVADAINNRVQAFADDGTFLGVVAGWGSDSDEATSAADGGSESTISLEYPYDIALGPDGDLFVVEYGSGRVTSLSVTGQLLGTYGANGRGIDEFWTPWGIAVGRDGRIFVADTGNKRIVELAP